MTSPDAQPAADPVHTMFGLTYSNYLVLPRTLLESMPQQWQAGFVRLVEQCEDAFAHVPQAPAYEVTAGQYHYIDDLTDEQLLAAGVTWTDDDEGGREYTARNGDALTRAAACVFIACEDPVPHYDRGRARIEPRLT